LKQQSPSTVKHGLGKVKNFHQSQRYLRASNLFRKNIDTIRSVVQGLLKGKRGKGAADDVDSD
jgi:hypothetical protein